jgi:Mn-dependent DtxR family transcriptional regulator
MRHEFMSMMLGVQRPGVSIALAALRRAGLVKHEKGSMHVLDRAGLEAAACECYEMVRKRFEWPAQP